MQGTYQKRGDRWRAIIMVHGRRRSATFDTKRQAQAWVAEMVTKGHRSRDSNWHAARAQCSI